MIKLPEAFMENMCRELDGGADAFFAALDMPYAAALRLNPLRKYDASEFADGTVAWEPLGRYIKEGTRPGASIAHFAGAFYVQEASAMLPVAMLDPKPGERVLDLCAAPGGKSTQIAARILGEGALVSNEIDTPRSKMLYSNIERLGIPNAVVLNESPERLEKPFSDAFDAVLVDTPCSGEGMFRREPDSRAEWTPASPEGCATRQRKILDSAAKMVADGGRLVYSTCTFNRTENDENAEWFANSHSDFEFIKSERIYPHIHRGDGQFAALFVKKGASTAHDTDKPRNDALKTLADFEREFGASPNGIPFISGDKLYIKSPLTPSLKGLKAVSEGLALAKIIPSRGGDRLEPEHSAAMAGLFPLVNLNIEQAVSYIRGEEISMESERGWRVAAYEDMPLGWVKSSGTVLKNHLPKGLRREIRP